MNGGCGFQCPNFGQEENCKEVISEMSNEELLKYYTDNEAFDSVSIVREELINRKLEKEVKSIDEQYCRQCIEDLNKKIEGTKQTIKLYEDVLVNGYQDQQLKSQFQRKNLIKGTIKMKKNRKE